MISYYTALPGVPIMWLGNFNMILNRDLDRFCPAPDTQTMNSPDTPLALLMRDTLYGGWLATFTPCLLHLYMVFQLLICHYPKSITCWYRLNWYFI